MGYVSLAEICACLMLPMCLVTVLLFCCKKARTDSFRERWTMISKKNSPTLCATLDGSEIRSITEPHPFLPPSLHELTASIGSTHGDRVDAKQADSNLVVPGSVVLLMRQDSATHRDCELPPVPPGGGIAQRSRYSICDDLPSESDGLYASVGRSGNEQLGLHHPERPTNIPASNCPAAQLACARQQRDSVADSAHAPYYSSVASVLAPNEYGELGEHDCLRAYALPNSPENNHPENLYARVRPCVGRSAPSGPMVNQEHFGTPNVTDDNRAFHPPTCRTRDSPPLPERGYGQSAIELVDHTRASHLHFLPTGGYSTSSAYPASPHLTNPLTSTSVQSAFSSSQSAGLLPHDVPTDYKECHYGKISVRESLASLRARKAMPHLGPPFARPFVTRPDLSANTTSEYERVSSSASDTNTSVYDFVPQASVFKEAALDTTETNLNGREIRFDQLGDPQIGTSCSSLPHPQVTTSHVPNRPDRQFQDFHTVFTNHSFRTQESKANSGKAFSQILTEMRAFRHVDSEVDLVCALSDSEPISIHHSGRCCGHRGEVVTVNTEVQSSSNANGLPESPSLCDTSPVISKPFSLNIHVPTRSHPRLMTPVMERSGESGSILFCTQDPGSSPSPVQVDQCSASGVAAVPHSDPPTAGQSSARTYLPSISDTSTYDDVALS